MQQIAVRYPGFYNENLTDAFSTGVSKEGAGAVDEEDFIKAFTDVPTVQVRHTPAHIALAANIKRIIWRILNL